MGFFNYLGVKIIKFMYNIVSTTFKFVAVCRTGGFTKAVINIRKKIIIDVITHLNEYIAYDYYEAILNYNISLIMSNRPC